MPNASRSTGEVSVGGVPGFDVSLRRYEPGVAQPWHVHRDAHLIVTVRGGFDEIWSRRTHDCAPDMALLRAAEERHANRYRTDGALCLVVRLESAWMPMLEDLGVHPGGHRSGELRPLVLRFCREMRIVDSATPIVVQSILLEMLSRFGSRGSEMRDQQMPAWIHSTIELLRSRLSAPPDVREAARLAGVHPAHLSRMFRRFTGMTMGGYVRRERLARASERLRRTDEPMAAIAIDAGFYDQAHFSRTFRSAFGLTPREFRRAHRVR